MKRQARLPHPFTGNAATPHFLAFPVSPKPLKKTLIDYLGFGAPHVADARGYRVRLFSLSPTDPAHARLRSACRKVLPRGEQVFFALLIVLALFFAVLQVPRVAQSFNRGFSGNMDWLPPVMVLPHVVIVLALWKGLRWPHSIAISEAIVAEGHCAACGYSLRGLEPEQDGATLCPECAAAWNVPKLPTTASVPGPTPQS